MVDLKMNIDDDLNNKVINIIKENEIEYKIEKIGEGQYSKVYKGLFKGIEVALKKLKIVLNQSDTITAKELNTEINNLIFLNSDYVPKFYGLSTKKNKKGQLRYFLVFEFIKGLTLRNAMPKLKMKEKLDIISQICDILTYFHEKKFIHRDLKPENVIIADGLKVKIIDFGTSKICSKTYSSTSKIVGTVMYMAPDNFDIEVDKENNPIVVSYKADIWSLGCMIAEMFSGVKPWANRTIDVGVIESQLMNKSSFPIPSVIKQKYPKLYQIIELCTEVDPQKRIDSTTLRKMVGEINIEDNE
jgi:serine/threonine protein kinase